MAKRVYDQGSGYGIKIGEAEISRFRSRWPASGLDGLRNVYAGFDKRNGDLVELECNRRGGSCERFDGEALKALTDDMQCSAAKKLKIDAGRDCDSRSDWKEYLGRFKRSRRKRRR